MSTMQHHPIDEIVDQLAYAAEGLAQGVMGVMTGLALVGLLWLSALRPADALGASGHALFTVNASISGHLGVPAAPAVDDATLQPASSVCAFDFVSGKPLPGLCVPGGEVAAVVLD